MRCNMLATLQKPTDEYEFTLSNTISTLDFLTKKSNNL